MGDSRRAISGFTSARKIVQNSKKSQLPGLLMAFFRLADSVINVRNICTPFYFDRHQWPNARRNFRNHAYIGICREFDLHVSIRIIFNFDDLIVFFTDTRLHNSEYKRKHLIPSSLADGGIPAAPKLST